VSGATVETVAPKRRRRFSASEKLRIVKAADFALASGERGAVAALLRKEGIYSSHLSSWRQQLAAHGSEGLEANKPVATAFDALGVSRASLCRRRQPPEPKAPPTPRPPSPRRLSDAERQRRLEVLHSDEFVDQPPREVYATLLGRGEYLCSIRTMYRVLAEAGECRERRHQRAPHVQAKPRLTASEPNQVWTWDITKLATTHKGVFLSTYVILDLSSRYVVGWMVADKE